jgi:hypothetical protein
MSGDSASQLRAIRSAIVIYAATRLVDLAEFRRLARRHHLRR